MFVGSVNFTIVSINVLICSFISLISLLLPDGLLGSDILELFFISSYVLLSIKGIKTFFIFSKNFGSVINSSLSNCFFMLSICSFNNIIYLLMFDWMSFSL